MKKHAEKVAIVTGAGGGFAGGTGRETSMRLASEGAKVILVDISEEHGKAVEKQMTDLGYDAFFVKCDIADEQQVEDAVNAAINKYGKLDILVNNAFIYDRSQAKLADLSIDEWDKQFAVNCRGHFLFCKFAIPHLIRNKESVIIFISSYAAICPGDAGTAYGAAKAAVIPLSGYIAAQYGRKGLRCNVVMPGFMLAGPAAELAAKDPERQKMFAIYDKNILLNRRGSGKDIANLINFLASDEASWITGATYVCDGGMSAHGPELAGFRDLLGN